MRIGSTLLEQWNHHGTITIFWWNPAKDMRQVFTAHATQIACVPQGKTLFNGTFERGRFSPIPIQYLTMVRNAPARRVLLRPEAKVQRVEYQQPVQGTHCPIKEMILLIPYRRWRLRAIFEFFFLRKGMKLIYERVEPVSIDPYPLSSLYNRARRTEYT